MRGVQSWAGKTNGSSATGTYGCLCGCRVNQLLRAYQQRPAVIHPDAAERVRQAQRLLGRVRPPERVHGNREECSICLDALALPVVTNCGCVS